MECTGDRKMKPPVHRSLASAARAYSVLQELVDVVWSHSLGGQKCVQLLVEKPSTQMVKREKMVAGDGEDNDAFLANLKRKRGHTICSETTIMFFFRK